ncbi:hypothetical protein DM02DRAFT_706997 [Periconia macrospinosa]|uniref:Uncharacterized protein n=1 Tax=Periconia macrospinosa TaxID=97972 RepID=A0A2V1CZF5_9PLEO|nr:hypothetical protein DM02DRAFT_706997 [Periconia macrospinosa]
MLHQYVLLAARNKELEEQLAVITKRDTRKGKQTQQGRSIERLVVVVIKKEPNQLYGAVGTVEALGVMHKRAEKIPKHLLNQMGARRT